MGNSLGCFSAVVFFPFCICGLCLREPYCSCDDLERSGRSRDFEDPRLLNLHLSPQLPESGSAELRKEVQQVVAAGWHTKMNLFAGMFTLPCLHCVSASLRVCLCVCVCVCVCFALMQWLHCVAYRVPSGLGMVLPILRARDMCVHGENNMFVLPIALR